VVGCDCVGLVLLVFVSPFLFFFFFFFFFCNDFATRAKNAVRNIVLVNSQLQSVSPLPQLYTYYQTGNEPKHKVAQPQQRTSHTKHSKKTSHLITSFNSSFFTCICGAQCLGRPHRIRLSGSTSPQTWTETTRWNHQSRPSIYVLVAQ